MFQTVNVSNRPKVSIRAYVSILLQCRRLSCYFRPDQYTETSRLQKSPLQAFPCFRQYAGKTSWENLPKGCGDVTLMLQTG
jgi:hypothetical protein